MSHSRRHTLLGALLMSILCTSCGERLSPALSSQRTTAQPAVEVAKVISQKLEMTVQLPGELQPYEVVAIYPKVPGFVKWINVDRGSRVKAGELIVRLEAPELVAQRAEAQAKLQSAQSQLTAAEAKLAADDGTYRRLKSAAETPGVVAGNDLLIAQKAAEADSAQVKSAQESANAAKEALQSVAQLEAYLNVKAPFDGVVTERDVHTGALVGPAGGQGGISPIVRIETLARLRLVVPVPETYVAGIPEDTRVEFTVPAFPGQTFKGPIARISHAVDVKTRTMPVELDVLNPTGALDPGSFTQVLWPVRRTAPTLFVPASAVATNLTRTFVIVVTNGKTQWVDVKTGAANGSLLEVFGDLHEGEEVVVHATDELRPDTQVLTKPTGSG